MENYNYDKDTHIKSTKKVFLFVFVLVLVAVGYYVVESSILISNTLTDDTISIKAPISFKETPDEYYYNEGQDMFLYWYYVPKEYGYTLDEMMPIVFSYWFSSGEYEGEYAATVDGREAYQLKYKCLLQAQNNMHYYYSGIFTVLELENRFLVVDIYYKLDEAKGVEGDISSKKLGLINDMVDSIKINDNTADFTDAAAKTFQMEMLKITLTEDWENKTEEGEYGENESGKYVYLENINSLALMQYSFSYENDLNDLDAVQQDLKLPQYTKYYTYIGEDVLAGEPCIIYSYSHLESRMNDSYVMGVLAMSEHYYVDMYIYSATEDMEISPETQEIFLNTILNR